MKFEEFKHLKAILESENKSIEEFIGKKLFEAEETSSDFKTWMTTIKAGFTKVLNPRAWWYKIKLDNIGLKLYGNIKTSLFDKFLNTFFTNKKKILVGLKSKLDAETDESKQKTIISESWKAITDQQDKQYNLLFNNINKLIQSTSTKISDIITKSNMSDTNKLKVTNYWIILSTGIEMSLNKEFQERDIKLLNEVLQDKAKKLSESNEYKSQIEKLNKSLVEKNKKIQELETKNSQIKDEPQSTFKSVESIKINETSKYNKIKIKRSETEFLTLEKGSDGVFIVKSEKGTQFTVVSFLTDIIKDQPCSIKMKNSEGKESDFKIDKVLNIEVEESKPTQQEKPEEEKNKTTDQGA